MHAGLVQGVAPPGDVPPAWLRESPIVATGDKDVQLLTAWVTCQHMFAFVVDLEPKAARGSAVLPPLPGPSSRAGTCTHDLDIRACTSS